MIGSLLVADASSLFRSAVRTVVVRRTSLRVVDAADLDGVARATAAQPIELALIDAALPPAGGVSAVAALVRSRATRVVVWSLEPTAADVGAALRAGAVGYLNKEIEPDELVEALLAVLDGEAALSSAAATRLVEGLHAEAGHERDLERAEELSARELQVLELAAAGRANRDIAGELRISEFTVKRHMQNILRKLDLTSRREAARFHRRLVQLGHAASAQLAA